MHAYTRFAAMIATSTVVMFGLMYLNTYQLDHVFFSETRTYMALVMGATMTVIMLAYMMGMYKNQRANIGIIVLSRGSDVVPTGTAAGPASRLVPNGATCLASYRGVGDRPTRDRLLCGGGRLAFRARRYKGIRCGNGLRRERWSEKIDGRP